MQAFVTGGAGFLGKALVRQLLQKNYRVITYSRGNYPELSKMGAVHRSGALDDYAQLVAAMAGCDIVFHVAAKAGFWGRYQDFYRTNVIGTENVLKACHELHIKKLVYTSTPSAIHSGKDIEGANESLPYPAHFEAFYPQTKATAERMVRAANDENLATVALRPHLIWGPEDHHFLPRFIQKARAGKLRLVGDGKKLVDCVYIDNAVKAHLLAAEKLYPGSPVAGKVYFITQGQPIPIADFINNMVKAAGLPPVTATIPFPVAYGMGMICENVYRWFGLAQEPPVTRFLARQLATAHWFDISAAKKDLGYTPDVSIEEGCQRLAEWLRTDGHKW